MLDAEMASPHINTHHHLMPQTKAVDLLPDEVRQELENRLLANGFGGYQGLTEWLQKQGFEIGRRSVAIFGKEFKDRHKALKLMREMAIAYRQDLPAGGDEAVQDTLLEAGKAITLEYSFLVLTALNTREGLEELKLLTPFVGTAARSIEAINRSDVAVAKYAAEVNGRVAALDGKPGIDQETLDRVKREIFGG
jgi:hypothetical protein